MFSPLKLKIKLLLIKRKKSWEVMKLFHNCILINDQFKSSNQHGSLNNTQNFNRLKSFKVYYFVCIVIEICLVKTFPIVSANQTTFLETKTVPGCFHHQVCMGGEKITYRAQTLVLYRLFFQTLYRFSGKLCIYNLKWVDISNKKNHSSVGETL